MIALMKFVHIAALAIWCAGLLALPMILARARTPAREGDAARMRMYAHHAYNSCVSPAAVIATISGGALVYLRGLFQPWFFAKLCAIGLLVILHIYLGHCVAMLGEKGRTRAAMPVLLVVPTGLAVMTAILVLVLAKPVIGPEIAPFWLRAPLDRQLPLPVVPS
jgi:putative membrane protein